MSLSKMKCELIDLNGSFNVRDLGGYAAGSSKINKRRFIRAGSLSNLTKKGEDQLRNLGINCIIDLRSNAEISRSPDILTEDSEIDYIHVPMLDHVQSNDGKNDASLFPASMGILYKDLLEASKSQFLLVFRALANPKYQTVLFHCTAGKDRTGVTAMLLLLFAGVSEEDITQDYSWSEQLIGPLKEQESEIEFPRHVFESKPENIKIAIDQVINIYGSAENYFDDIGITKEDQKNLLIKLIG